MQGCLQDFEAAIKERGKARNEGQEDSMRDEIEQLPVCWLSNGQRSICSCSRRVELAANKGKWRLRVVPLTGLHRTKSFLILLV